MEETIVIAISTAVTAVIAIAGLILARQQIGASRQLAAQNAYETYHHLVLTHTLLGAGLFEFESASAVDREKYRWLVLSMLMTVERILTLFPRDKQWAVALQHDIMLHHRFIASEFFRPHLRTLDPKVVALIGDVLKLGPDKIESQLQQLGMVRAAPGP